MKLTVQFTVNQHIRSGNALIDGLFDLCVKLLLWGADLLGISYKEINVWVFCAIWPLLTIALICLVIYQQIKLKAMKALATKQNPQQVAEPDRKHVAQGGE